MSYRRFEYEKVKALSEAVFTTYGFTYEESCFITDVIITADLFGIESHGINRLSLYSNGIDIGRIKLGAACEVIYETPVSAVIDANDGEGHLASKIAMELAIDKAKNTGIGMVTVRNSNHFGIAGYYSRMAIKEDFMGICMTNAEALVVPTYGKEPMIGTNPIAISMPANPYPYNLDMSTSVVTGGKLEVYAKNNKPLQKDWIVDKNGNMSIDPHEFIRIRNEKSNGGILPLGGYGEAFGGHKGYGLSLLVELMTGNFSGGANGDNVRKIKNEEKCCHFFGVIDYGIFGDKNSIVKEFSDYLERIRQSEKADGFERIYTHGEKEQENTELVRKKGIAMNEATILEIINLCKRINIDYKRYLDI